MPDATKQLTIMVFQGVQNTPFFAAESQGYFAKRGLSLDIRVAPNSDELRNGLAEGRYQIVHTAADNAIALAEVAKKDIAVVMGGDTGINHLMVQADIASIADLRGRTVIVDALATAYALQLYKLLKMNGLNKGDYEIVSVGASNLRRDAMLKDKNYAATMVNPPFNVQLQKAGLRDLGSAVTAMGDYQASAAFVMRDWARANADTLVAYIQAYIEGLRYALDPANRAAVEALLVEKLKLAPDVATESFARYSDPKEGFAKDARISLDGFRNMLALRAEMTGGTAASPEKYIDLSYYEKALAGLSPAGRA